MLFYGRVGKVVDVRRKRIEAGFSLVELMIALVIGLIIVLGAGQLYLVSKENHTRMTSLSKRQEALRSIVDFVSLDVRTASTISASGTTLRMDYASGRRSDDPYCTSGADLDYVEYSHSGDDINVTFDCGDGASGPEALVSGVEEFSFSYPANERYVEIEVKFPNMQGEAEEKSRFNFIVARRGEVF